MEALYNENLKRLDKLVKHKIKREALIWPQKARDKIYERQYWDLIDAILKEWSNGQDRRNTETVSVHR